MNNSSSYAVVGYRECRSWSILRERAFKTLAQEAGASCEVFACQGESAAKRARRMAGWVVKRLGGSRRLVELRFRETLGHSILDEIQNVRMARVQFLLAKTDTPISAIAAFCGYKTDIALRKAFRLLTGKSLADWRKANR